MSPAVLDTRITAVYSPAFEEPILIPLAESTVPAGFPSPADDSKEQLDIAAHLVRRPESTYYGCGFEITWTARSWALARVFCRRSKRAANGRISRNFKTTPETNASRSVASIIKAINVKRSGFSKEYV